MASVVSIAEVLCAPHDPRTELSASPTDFKREGQKGVIQEERPTG